MEYRPGEDIFETGAEVIVNPVNCRVDELYARHEKDPVRFPTAQKGLAGVFETRYPGAQGPLRRVCASGAMKPGMVQLVGVNRESGEKADKGSADLLVAHLATKDHWQDPSRIEWVDRGLEKLAGAVEARGAKSVAIPMLGSGMGKLSWSDVRPLVEKHFRPLSEKGVKVSVLGDGPKKDMDKDMPSQSGSPARPDATKSAMPTGGQGGAGNDGSSGGEDEAREITTPSQSKRPAGTKYYAGIGARDTPDSVLKKMREVGKILAKSGFVLRSGAAAGADSAFEEGSDAVDPDQKEIFLPWNGFDPKRDGRKRFANGKSVFADEPTQAHVDLARKYHPKYDQLGSGPRNMHARNGSQMFGRKLDRPSDVVVCWTQGGQVKGGTGQALRIAEDNGIEIVNMGDPRIAKLPAPAVARVVVSVAEGKKIGKALTEERVRAKREEAMEL